MSDAWVFWPSMATFAILVVYFWTAAAVGMARGRHGVPAPAVTGHPVFERAYRVQMNTLEWLPLVLPALWIFAWYADPIWAFALGLAWIGGRVLYMTAYMQAPEKRGPGFLIQLAAWAVLFLGGFGAALLSQLQIRLF